MSYKVFYIDERGRVEPPEVRRSPWRTRYVFSDGDEVTLQEKHTTKTGLSALRVSVTQRRIKDRTKDWYVCGVRVPLGTSTIRLVGGRWVGEALEKPPHFPSVPIYEARRAKPTETKRLGGKTRILYVSSNTAIGGAETVLKRLIRTIDRSLYQVDVLVTHYKGRLHGEYKENSDKLTYVPRRELSPSYVLNYAKRGGYDYVHFFNLWDMYGIIPNLKTASPRTRIIVSLLVDIYYHHKTGGQYWKRIVNNIRNVRRYLWSFITDAHINRELFKEITVIHDGIPVETFSPAPKKPKTVAWVGRLSPSKKVDLIPKIARKLPAYRFTLIGDKKTKEYQKIMRSKPKNLEIKIGLKEREVADILAETQFYIFTSRSEAMPLTVLEAMSCGCCVVSERVGDVPRVIEDKRNGYLIPAGADTVNWIAENLPKLSLRVCREARKKVVDEYSLSQMVKRYEFLYGLMGSHKRQTRIAFLSGYPAFYPRFWEKKVDSMQHAIAKLGRHNVVQVFVPTDKNPSRKILNGQNIHFYKYKNVPDLIKTLRNFRPHMIFMDMFRGGLWPHIVNAFPHTWKSVMHYGDQSLICPEANKLNVVIVQQEYLRKPVAEKNKIPIEKVQVNAFCIEQWLFKPQKREKKYTGIMVADFRRDIKRQDLLIKAWKDIPGKLLLVGRYDRSKPPYHHKACQHLALKLDLQNRIEFINDYPHNKLPSLINQAKIAFMTSSHEGGSRALMEMMACGLPALVLSDCPGTVNMIKDGVDGLVANPNPQSIAEQAKKLLGKHVEMGKKASQRIRRDYPYDKMYQAFRGYVVRYRPEVSIITTSMNRGKYLEQNIKSVLTQKNNVKINHIIMDGGSKDNTLAVLHKYQRHVYAYIKRDMGQTDALVRAMDVIEESFPQTSYVGWINADDYYQPNWLSEALPQLRVEPSNVAMVCGDAHQVGQYNKDLHYTSERYINLKLIGRRGSIIIQPTVLIRFSALKKLKSKYGYSFNPNIHYVQDLELWYRFLINGFKIKHLTDKTGKRGLNIVANLRAHPDQLSRTHMKQQTVERDRILRAICVREGIVGPPWMKSR